MKRIARVAALLAAFTACAPALGSGTREGELRLRVAGNGPVTVVFEAGLGDTLDVWRNVQDQVASGCARTVTYSRAGYPGSGKAVGHRDAVTIVSELRVELTARGVAPPYVLVAHSLGGLYAQFYARSFPDEVAGLVLVDSTHWDQLARIQAEAPAMYGTLKVASLLMFGTMRKEFVDSVAAGAQVKEAPESSRIPAIVLSSTRAAPGETPAFRGLMHTLQDEIAAEYGALRHDFVPGSGHYIQRDRPGAVIGAIRELAGCSS